MGRRSSALVVAGQGFYPEQTPIDAYGNGGFRFAGMSHRGSLLCLPSGMHSWAAAAPSEITLISMQAVLAAASDLDVLLVGMGEAMTGFDPAIRDRLRSEGVIVEAITTGSAVRTYNILLAESRAVGAALLAVENAR